ncbi:MAG: branched-chain amino acid ABC transporter permease [Armatimonadota bacterium]|nr:branched-chain amino acid ABC transporter permease [Armatimonadota bacterium]MDR7445314.1 branched-chain amino acid ABC transporter permease [Armatimonadota bacterium]MDR7569796.1 branched-chain amino acid ABC transporter permease [Armatimonadota bacterium]MDR7614049.1 branched-chain amino acid ABC transporter permease [Armatimonadota bacterium]
MVRNAPPRLLQLGGVVLFLLLPWVLSEYQRTLLSLTFLYAIFAMSLDLLYGYAGIESLGHAAFWGMGAYTAGLLGARLGIQNMLLGTLSGMLAAGILATVIAPAVLRTRGIVSLMAFLAISMMLWGGAVKWRSFTGGDDGLTGVPRLGEVLPSLGGTSEYYLLLLVFLGCLILLRRVGQSSFGLVLQGIRENENRMRTLGYNTQLHKFLALVGSGMMAGLAGALLAYHNGFVGPTELHILTSAEGLVMVLVGGPGTFLGPALGAFVVTLVKHWISGYTEYWAALLGIGYVLVVRYAPAGLYPPLAAAWARRMQRPREAWKRAPAVGEKGS